jgi:hypothetical protein
MQIDIIGVPIDLGADRRGVDGFIRWMWDITEQRSVIK